MNQNTTLQNSVLPDTDVVIQNVPTITYGSQYQIAIPNTSTSQTTNEAPSQNTNKKKTTTKNIVKQPQTTEMRTITETMAMPDISKEYRLGTGDQITIYAWSGDFLELNISQKYIYRLQFFKSIEKYIFKKKICLFFKI